MEPICFANWKTGTDCTLQSVSLLTQVIFWLQKTRRTRFGLEKTKVQTVCQTYGSCFITFHQNVCEQTSYHLRAYDQDARRAALRAPLRGEMRPRF